MTSTTIESTRRVDGRASSAIGTAPGPGRRPHKRAKMPSRARGLTVEDVVSARSSRDGPARTRPHAKIKTASAQATRSETRLCRGAGDPPSMPAFDRRFHDTKITFKKPDASKFDVTHASLDASKTRLAQTSRAPQKVVPFSADHLT